jgi:hypothetical protein
MAFTAAAVPLSFISLSFIDLPPLVSRGEDERARWNVTAETGVEMIETCRTGGMHVRHDAVLAETIGVRGANDEIEATE